MSHLFARKGQYDKHNCTLLETFLTANYFFYKCLNLRGEEMKP
jgi:hypothetical protein